ncbi:type III pantothenate kinase [bacterium]|nr:type III pantothenate kinase [bacterium]
MILTLDVGNTQIHGGIFKDGQLLKNFRINTYSYTSSDELGLFLKSILREWELSSDSIEGISICSVVPFLHHALEGASKRYFNQDPFFVEAGIKTGLKIRYKNPAEVGADRIVNAAYAQTLFPNQNMVLVDLGTATTFCVVNQEQEYLGGVIMPGIQISQKAMSNAAAKLPQFEIARPKDVFGRTTIDSLQCGIYYGHIGAINHIVDQIKRKEFKGLKNIKIIGTGGYTQFIQKDLPFDFIDNNLTLKGLYYLWSKNH